MFIFAYHKMVSLVMILTSPSIINIKYCQT